MEDIKELVATALEQKRVLSRLKAELRAHVFLAIDEQEKSNGNAGLTEKTDNPQRQSLTSSPEGLQLMSLVREFLEWAGLEFTLKVYEPEIGPMPTFKSRSELGRQLGMTDVPLDAPLLMALLHRVQGSPPSAAAAQQQGIAPLPSAARLSSLQPLSRSSLAPLDPVQQHGSMPTQVPANVLEPPSKLAQGPAASADGTQPGPIAAATNGAKPFPDQAHETAKPLAQAYGKATSVPKQTFHGALCLQPQASRPPRQQRRQ
ncbi:hypothetical protein V8C86DRAFT_2700373 [Haematococcus lacustris]